MSRMSAKILFVAIKPRRWCLLSNHGLVLVAISQVPDDTVMGIVRRTHLHRATVLRVLRDLEEAGMITINRQGRRNLYRIDPAVALRHPIMRHIRVQDLLGAVAPEST